MRKYAAFAKALERGGDVYVPPGTYRLSEVKLPEDTFLHGAARASLIVADGKSPKPIQITGSRCRIADLRFTGEPKYDGEGQPATDKGLIFVAPTQKDVAIDNIRVDDYLHAAVLAENTDGLRVTNSHFEKVGWGVHLVWVKRAYVAGNRVVDAKSIGMQFWGNADFKTMACEDLIFANNYFKDTGQSPIFGTGARRVVIIGNGAKDVGLDPEWCEDVTIVGNTVRNCENAAISLFLSCKNVTISGNSIVITKGKTGRRDGIWLTATNNKLFKEDHGHRFVSITGNTIIAESESPRHGICIESGRDVVCSGNVMQNADLFDRTGQNIPRERREELRRSMTVVPFSQEWRFKTDPDDVGVKQKWFAEDLNDGD